MPDRVYIACDLKSFYASVECIERGLDPLTTNLVVADKSRTEKTICLAVSPSLKAYGISGRARLFEVVQKVAEVNAQRLWKAPGRQFSGSSWNDPEVKRRPELALDYLTAPPRMAHYIQWSTKIYNVYLKYVAPSDIHVYSIDEVLMDVTNYLPTYQLTPRELARKIVLDVLDATGITATAGIGPNLYLAKVAMDIWAKHTKPDRNGVRVAELSEMSYRRLLWEHRPLTDFWRVGRGYTKKLEAQGLFTMGDIARCSIGKPTDYYNEELLYRMFGVNAELLIDHAWGYEPVTMADIKAYKPEAKSVGSGQVLTCPYDFTRARMVAWEMADQLALDLVGQRLVTDQLTLTVGYDIDNLRDPDRRKQYQGAVTTDRYGRQIPKHAHGTANLEGYTDSAKRITAAVLELFDRIVNRDLLVRRLYLTANRVTEESSVSAAPTMEQLDLFTDAEAAQAKKAALAREKKLQETMLGIKSKFGKNAILKGTNLVDGATAADRNGRIGGAQSVMGAYDDIINLPHPTSSRHPRMPMIDRAAQFTPFQALTGYGAAIQETARLTGEKVELTEEEKAVLDEKLRFLADTGKEAAFTYFQPDGRKSGGVYVTAVGTVKKLDPLEGRLTLTDGTAIPIEDILEIEDETSAGFPLKEEML